MFSKHKKNKKSNDDPQGKFTKFIVQKLFEKNKDVILETHLYEGKNVTFIMCDGMIDQQMLNEVVFVRLTKLFEDNKREKLTAESINSKLHVPDLKELKTEEDLIKEVFLGKLLILFHEQQIIFSVGIASRPQRSPEETSTEISIKGPRDDFIEDITVNIALIRKRLRTTSLAIKKYEIGTRTQTQVALLYIDDVIDKEIVKEIDKRLRAVNIDGIYSGTQLKELLSEKDFNFYPTFHYSGRPDFCVNSLLSGRFLIFIDGVQYAILAPVNLAFFLKSGEDSEATYLFNTFERTIRLMALIMAIFLPGLWVALSSFHQNQLPVTFLGTVIESRLSVPLPAPLETLLMIILFEFFREAGMRMPMAIGTTLSVVGGLIIGDAAIRAGLASPILIVVIASSSVATYTLVSLSLHGIVSILRLFVVVLSSFVGLYGFCISVFLIVLSVARIDTFGVAYISVPGEVSIKDMFKTFVKWPVGEAQERPTMLTDHQDRTKGGKNKSGNSS